MADIKRMGYRSGSMTVDQIGLPPSLFGTPPPEFCTIASIRNATTGEWVAANFEIHRDDIDWAIQLWQARLELDWELDQAARGE